MIDTSLLTSITGLALADSVNPCEMAVLLIVLVTILTKNPENRKKVLYAGLAFVSAIFIGYLIYAFLLIQFFSFLTVKISGFSVYVYNGLAIFSMIMGALNIKDRLGSSLINISDDEIYRIARMVITIEGLFRKYQDIELLLTQEKGIVVVQARPL